MGREFDRNMAQQKLTTRKTRQVMGHGMSWAPFTVYMFIYVCIHSKLKTDKSTQRDLWTVR